MSYGYRLLTICMTIANRSQWRFWNESEVFQSISGLSKSLPTSHEVRCTLTYNWSHWIVMTEVQLVVVSATVLIGNGTASAVSIVVLVIPEYLDMCYAHICHILAVSTVAQ